MSSFAPSCLARVDVAHDLVELRLADLRALRRLGIERIADLAALRVLVEHLLDELVVNLLSARTAALPAQQHWPWLKYRPKCEPSTAASRSASAKTMFGLLPPSSNVTRFSSTRAAACMMSLPVSVEPVNATLSTSRVLARCRAGGLAVAGHDVDHAVREAGFLRQLAMRRRVSGVCSAGFITIVQPARERRAPLPRHHQQREVPRDDLPDDADRLVPRVA